MKKSFRNITAKSIGLPVQDLIMGTRIHSTHKFLERSQYWDPQQMEAYRLKKLKDLIDYSAKKVPYYIEIFGRLRLKSSDIKTIEDIKKIPVLTKDTMRKEVDRLISNDYNKFKVKIGKTGGTTGVPVKIYKDEHNRSFTWASYYRWYKWMGLSYGDPVTTLWGSKLVLSESLKDKYMDKLKFILSNSKNVNTFNMIPNNMGKIAEYVLSSNTVLLKGYLSSLINFGKFVQSNSIRFPHLKAVSTTTESLLPHNRKFLEKAFGVPVYDQYGCGEISAISYECTSHKGLHINLEHVICEVVDEDLNPLMNQSGRLLATDLDNKVMPLIRYENGDYATLTDEPCDCGVNQPLMKSIDGRTTDTLTLKTGAKVHGVFITDVFNELDFTASRFQRFQVIQKEEGKIILYIEATDAITEKEKQVLEKALLNFFIEIEIFSIDRIDNELNGKYLYIKSLLG